MTIVAVLSFLAFVTWIGLRFAERAHPPDAASSEEAERIAKEYSERASRLRSRAREDMITYPTLARHDMRKAERIEKAVEKLRRGQEPKKVERWLAASLWRAEMLP